MELTHAEKLQKMRQMIIDTEAQTQHLKELTAWFLGQVRVSAGSMDEVCRDRGTRKEAVTEYCIMQENRPGVHRGPWSEEECLDWLQEAEDDGVRSGCFYIATRAVSEWKKGY